MTARRITYGVIRVTGWQLHSHPFSVQLVKETAGMQRQVEDTRRDHDLWSLLCKNLRHAINFPFAKGEVVFIIHNGAYYKEGESRGSW